MAEASLRPLTNETDWSAALSHSEEEAVILLKHSNACPVSGRAKREIETLAGEVDRPVYEVVVQENRSLSDEIAERLGVRHETPQALIIWDREAAYDTSHFDVTRETLETALDTVTAQNGDLRQ